jgi:hypothetical protein
MKEKEKKKNKEKEEEMRKQGMKRRNKLRGGRRGTEVNPVHTTPFQ